MLILAVSEFLLPHFNSEEKKRLVFNLKVIFKYVKLLPFCIFHTICNKITYILNKVLKKLLKVNTKISTS